MPQESSAARGFDPLGAPGAPDSPGAPGAPDSPGAPDAFESVTTVRTKGVHRVPLTVSSPPGDPQAGVVLIQEAFGITDALVATTRRLAAEGYLTVAPHLYHRVAKKPVTEFAQARPLLASLNGEDMTHDIADARGYLDAAGVGPEHVGIVGLCMGGTVSLWQAAVGNYAAAVTFYGGGVSTARWRGVPPGVESAARITCPWLGLYGEKDRSIPPADVATLRAITGDLNLPTSIITYPAAGHAFANDPESPRYVADAAADAWGHAVNWLDAHLQ